MLILKNQSMKKFLYLSIACLCIGTFVKAQDGGRNSETPCYTKHWVDSVNTANLERLNSSAPNMFEWYVYEGQTQPVPQPSSIINVIKVKLVADCPEQKKNSEKK